MKLDKLELLKLYTVVFCLTIIKPHSGFARTVKTVCRIYLLGKCSLTKYLGRSHVYVLQLSDKVNLNGVLISSLLIR